jgi:hypothetical protein
LGSRAGQPNCDVVLKAAALAIARENEDPAFGPRYRLLVSDVRISGDVRALPDFRRRAASTSGLAVMNRVLEAFGENFFIEKKLTVPTIKALNRICISSPGLFEGPESS